jgi:hypothetical protein
VAALEDVAAKDQASGAGFHRLARLLQHDLIAGVLTAGDQQQRPVGRSHHGVDGVP